MHLEPEGNLGCHSSNALGVVHLEFFAAPVLFEIHSGIGLELTK